MPTPTTQHCARLFRNGRNQAVRIPRKFELPGQEVAIRKDGDLRCSTWSRWSKNTKIPGKPPPKIAVALSSGGSVRHGV